MVVIMVMVVEPLFDGMVGQGRMPWSVITEYGGDGDYRPMVPDITSIIIKGRIIISTNLQSTSGE